MAGTPSPVNPQLRPVVRIEELAEKGQPAQARKGISMINEPSRAREFFTRITSTPDPVDSLRGLINPADPVYESDWLDCKADPQKDKELKEIWYTALGGFANNQGG